MRTALSGAALGAVLAAQAASGDALDDCGDMLDSVGPPAYLDDDRPANIFLCRLGYVLSYNTETRVPDWVVEELAPARFQGDADRLDNFAEDATLPDDVRSTLADYRGSRLDRGHMAPAADMTFDQAAMDESFLLSNMAPQVGIGFNRHIWSNLESAARDWTRVAGATVVMTGPAYDDADIRTIGGNGVAVPTHFYKIVFDPARKRVLAFLLPNEKLSGQDFGDFQTTVDTIEAATGLDFLTPLSKRDEDRLERGKAALWRSQ